MIFNDEVDWSEIFADYISRPSLADPANRDRLVFVRTMLLVEAGLREVDDQLAGRGRTWKNGLSWGRVTRGSIVKRATRIAMDLSDHDLRRLHIGEWNFRHIREWNFRERWEGDGGMFNFTMCVVRYACTSRRWRRVLDYGPRKAMAELPRVRRGELSLTDLITQIATYDLRMRARLANLWLFPLSLTMDATWKSVANQAQRELLDFYADLWVPVYEEGLRLLGVRLRPGMSAKKLSAMISAQISGFTEHIASAGDESPDADSVALFAESAQALIYAAIDPGDGLDVSDALLDLVRPR